MDDDELRAVLLHEFGHFAQEALKSTYSIYILGQLSRIQLKTFPEMYNKDMSMRSMKKAVLESFISTYMAYRLKFLRRVKQKMDVLSEYLEYDADDVAAEHINYIVLQRALLHASQIEHVWNVIEWGLGILRERDDIFIDNPYLALSLLGKEDFAYSSNPPAIQRRINRLGATDKGCTIQAVSEIVIREQTVERYFRTLAKKGIRINADDFYQWIKTGYDVYEEQIRKAKSIDLTLCMGQKLHRSALIMNDFEILLDGRYVGMGSIKKGFCFQKKIAPGKHTVTAYLPVNFKGKPYTFIAEEQRSYSIDFDYTYFKQLGYYEVFVSKEKES